MGTHRDSIYTVPEFYEYLKHLVSLSIGTLLLILTFIDKFIILSGNTQLLGCGIGSLLLSIITSGLCMLSILSIKRYKSPPPRWETNLLLWSGVVAVATYLTGILFVGISVIINITP